MPGTGQADDSKDQVFEISKTCDATKLSLTAAEGYLFSRIDGTTPWRLLREIGGIPAADVDVCLERWIEEGVVETVVRKSSAKPTPHVNTGESAGNGSSSPSTGSQSGPRETDAASAPKETTTIPMVDLSAIDESLDLDASVQQRILEFEASLAAPYHELLGVPKGSNPKVVKRAYFMLSKEFHPDRYFRKNIGDYGKRLDRIFKKVLEAHEILSDPDLCQVENHVEAESSANPSNPAAENAAPSNAASQAPPAPRELTKLERLRQRMPFKIDHAGIAARRAKAEEIFRAACSSQQAGRLAEAEASLRIAISFDPTRVEFKEALGSLRIAAAGDRASKLLAKPNDRMSDTELREVMTLLEDVLIYRPHDPELNERAARVSFKLDRLDDAIEYTETLIARSPEVAAHHSLLGRIYRAKKNPEAASRAFETALKFDKDDLDARREIAAMRIGHHDSVRGGDS